MTAYPSQPPQIFPGLPYIPPNLLFQRFDRREFDLVPQAIEEVNLNFGFRSKFKGMKI